MRAIAWIVAMAGGVSSAIAPNVSYAQTKADSAHAEPHDKTEASLAKAAQNPVANMVSLPLQYNFYAAGGLGSTPGTAGTALSMPT